jgi:hypothetical protein
MVMVILVPPDLPHTVRIIHRKFLEPYRTPFKLNEVKMVLRVIDLLNRFK